MVGQLRPEQTGVLLVLYGALPMFVLVPVSIFLLRHFDPRVVLVIGLSAFATANLLGHAADARLGARRFHRDRRCCNRSGRPSPCCRSFIIALSNSDPTRATAFAAYIQIMRLGGAEIGVALMGTWLRVREQIHSNFLGQHLENGSADVDQILSGLAGVSRATATGTAPARAVGSLSALVQREANVLAYIDGFWLTFWLAIAALGFVALMTRAPPGPFTPAPFGVARAADAAARMSAGRIEASELTPPARSTSASARSVPAAGRTAACACGP